MRRSWVAGLSVALCAASAVAQSGLYRAPSGVRLGGAAHQLRVFDADADGTEEGVVAAADGIFVASADAAGTLAAPVRLALGGEVTGVADGLIDADGLVDLVAVVVEREELLFLPGTGTRALTDNPVGPGSTRYFGVPEVGVDLGAVPLAVALARLDGDQHLDAVVSLQGVVDSEPGRVVVLLGDGNGAFVRLPQELDVGVGVGALAAVDVDRDQVTDLVALEVADSSLRVFLGVGDGTFAAGERFALAAPPLAMTVAELDGTPGPELAVASNQSAGVDLLDFDATGRPSPFDRVATGSGAAGVAVAELDGDGIDELLVANRRSQDVAVVDYDGGSSVVDRYVVGDEPVLIAPVALAAEAAPGFLAIVGGQASSDARLVRPRGTRFQAAENLGFAGLTDVALGDVDEDGDVDVVVVGGSELAVLAWTGEGFSEIASNSFAAAVARVVVWPLADGGIRLAASLPELGEVAVLRAAGAGFSREAGLSVGFAPEELAVGDYNGDGSADLAVGGTAAGELAVIWRSSAGQMVTLRSDLALGRIRRMRSLDADCDGADDLAVVETEAGRVSVLRGASIVDEPFSLLQVLEAANSVVASVVAADFDADGRDDLLVGSDFATDGRTLRFFRGTCPGAFVAAPFVRNLAAGQSVLSQATIDLDGDALVDVVAANAADNAARTFLGSSIDDDGFPTFVSRPTDDASRRPERLAVGDVDGDGLYDIAAANLDVNGQVVTLLYNCSAEADCDPFRPPSGVAHTRGDGNRDGVLSAADYIPLAGELADGDGERVDDAVRLGLANQPDIDVNGDAMVDRQDARGLAARIFRTPPEPQP